jgi:hypothetical protein
MRCGSGSNLSDPGIWDGKNSDPVSGINIPDPQHWICNTMLLSNASKIKIHQKQNLTLLSLHREECFSNLRTFIRIHWYTVPPTFQFTVWEDGFDYIVFFSPWRVQKVRYIGATCSQTIGMPYIMMVRGRGNTYQDNWINRYECLTPPPPPPPRGGGGGGCF